MFCKLVALTILGLIAYNLVFADEGADAPGVALNEEDVVQICLTRNIDCSFLQPLTLFGIEASLHSGKTAKDVCRGLRESEKCMTDLLDGQCAQYIQDKDKLQAAREIPVIDYLCNEDTLAYIESEENWECLSSSLTEGNLNSCSESDDQSSCDVTDYVNCLAEQFSEKCSEEARQIFTNFYTDLTLLKRPECTEGPDEPGTTEEPDGPFETEVSVEPEQPEQPEEPEEPEE